MKSKPRVPVFRRFLPECHRRRVGRVDIPQEAFLAVLKVAAGSSDEE
jgi:hypothetical protein